MRTRRTAGVLVAAAAVTVGVTLAVAPAARAEIARTGAKVAKWLGWHTFQVRSGPRIVYEQEPDGRMAPRSAGGSVAFDRSPTAGVLKGVPEQKYVHMLAEARALLPPGVALPPDLEGTEMLVTRVTDGDGTVPEASLAAPEAGFWARYRKGGNHDRVHATYDADFKVSAEEVTVAGRQVRVVTAELPGGKSVVSCWLEDGPWSYELQGYGREMERLMQMLRTME